VVAWSGPRGLRAAMLAAGRVPLTALRHTRLPFGASVRHSDACTAPSVGLMGRRLQYVKPLQAKTVP
jgi:hypothetical protein